MGRWVGILGIAVILGTAFLFSSNRRAFKLKTLLWGVGLQFSLALFVLRVDFGRTLLEKAGAAVTWLLAFSYKGSEFVFGQLGAQVPGFLVDIHGKVLADAAGKP